MYSKCFPYFLFAISMIGILLVSGCTQTAKPPQEAISAANVTAERVLGSINDGNYGDFSRNFSDPMLQGINQSRFEDLRTSLINQYGKYVSKSGPQAIVVNGDNVFIYDCQFEKGRLQFQFSINSTDQSTVTGLYYRT